MFYRQQIALQNKLYGAQVAGQHQERAQELKQAETDIKTFPFFFFFCSCSRCIQVWNPTLEMIAQEHTENCQWEPNDMRHAEAEHLFPTGVGESMAVSYGRSAIINQSPEQFVQEWFDEKRFYNITYNTCEPGRICDHYTQVSGLN